MSVDLEQLFSWTTYQSVSVNLSLFWLQGEPTSTSVDKSLEFRWKQGAKIQVGKTLEWDIKTIRNQIDCTWNISALGIDRGNPKVQFWALHTGEQNSGQVIRFRNAANLSNIVWESGIERNVKGQIQVYLGWEDPTIQDRLKITQTLYSDWNINPITGRPQLGYKVIRPDAYISRNTLPFYVFHEYASTQDMKYIIRYLGYVNSPSNYYNGPRRPYKIEEIIETRGACIFPTNFSGKSYNVTIRFRNGDKISGILPNKAAIAVIKNDNGNYQVGYVPYESLPVYAGANVSFDPKQIKRGFKPFQ